MEKVKTKLKNLPILPAFMLITIFFILLAMLLVECEKTAIKDAQYAIAFQYSDIVALMPKKCGAVIPLLFFQSITVN